jgi:hypothetical protein
MERGEELMELNRTAFERNTQAFERVMAALDRHEQLFEEGRRDKDDLKVFIREMNVRAERRFQEWRKCNDEFHAEQAARTDAIVRHLGDLSQESKAHREALLALIDRLPPTAEAA